jgi:hypothetical protein
MQTLWLQIGVGFPSARSSIGSAVKVVSTSRSRVIFLSVFTGCPLFTKGRNLVGPVWCSGPGLMAKS